jgi:hypothetical protein
MEKKILCIIVSMLLFATVVSVTGNENIIDKNVNGTYISEKVLSFPLLKGKMAYGQCLQSTNYDLVTFDLSAPDPWTVIGPGTAATDFLSGGDFVLDVWYACEYSTTNSNIWTIDETTGTMTLVGASGALLNGIAYDDSTDTLYGCSSTSLYTINKGTGVATLIGAMGNAGGTMIGIASDGFGNLYGEDLGDDNLYSINTGTGAATVIGPMGVNINYAQDMAIDKDDGTCYITGYKGSTAGGGALMWVDLTTGHATLIGNFPIGTMSCPSEVDAFAIPYSINEPPLTPGAPSGPNTGLIGVEYPFTANTTDPEGDPIEYWFEWGDGENSGWVSPGSANHAWASEGTYGVTVKARDAVHGGESAFSPAHSIEILGGPILDISAVKSGLKIKVDIENNGGADAPVVDYTITLEGGAIIGKSSNGTTSITVGNSVEVTSGLIIGFGKTKVTVTATCPESSDTVIRNGFVIFFFTYVRAGG